MAVEVKIPAVLRKHVAGASELPASSGSLREVLAELVRGHPEFGEQVFTDGGDLHRFINIYVNDEDVRYLEGLETKVGEGDVVAILPAVAGGRTLP